MYNVVTRAIKAKEDATTLKRIVRLLIYCFIEFLVIFKTC